MDPLERVEIGATGVSVTRLGLGGAPLGDVYGPLTDSEADSVIAKALGSGVRYIDTAPLYGTGKSESRLGGFFATQRPPDLVLSTKVGRALLPAGGKGDATNGERSQLTPPFDFTRQGVMRSIEGSLERLGVSSVDILFIHDPDDHYQEAISEAYPTLANLRDSGRVRAIGAGMNQWEMELRFAQEGDFDCFLLAGRYTLLDQGALDAFLPYCQENRISVIAGAPFNNGILASDLRQGAIYDSRVAPAPILEKARRIGAICSRHGVPLKAAALQFILAHPIIASVIPGARTPMEMEENAGMIRRPIPREVWDELKQEGLIPEKAYTPR